MTCTVGWSGRKKGKHGNPLPAQPRARWMDFGEDTSEKDPVNIRNLSHGTGRRNTPAIRRMHMEFGHRADTASGLTPSRSPLPPGPHRWVRFLFIQLTAHYSQPHKESDMGIRINPPEFPEHRRQDPKRAAEAGVFDALQDMDLDGHGLYEFRYRREGRPIHVCSVDDAHPLEVAQFQLGDFGSLQSWRLHPPGPSPAVGPVCRIGRLSSSPSPPERHPRSRTRPFPNGPVPELPRALIQLKEQTRCHP